MSGASDLAKAIDESRQLASLALRHADRLSPEAAELVERRAREYAQAAEALAKALKAGGRRARQISRGWKREVAS